jgi:hypothetical protein
MAVVQLTDLKIGMYLKNDSNVPMPLYDNRVGKIPPLLIVNPGELIGQITDYDSGAEGPTVIFTSERINEAHKGLFSMWKWYFTWKEGSYYGASGRLSHIQRVVSLAQVQQQKLVVDKAESEGFSFMNGIKKVLVQAADTVKETAEALIPWNIVLAIGAGYVLLNWNTFFSQKKLS